VSWARAFTDEMLALKHAGHTFDRAWKVARDRYPIQTKELGGAHARSASNLFESASGVEAQKQAVVWWRDVCRAAWENAPAADGQPSRLALLPGLLDAVTGTDESSSARKIHRAHAA